MTDFWPSGLILSDIQSPKDILSNARSNWESESGGLLTLVLQEAKSKDGNEMIIVHAKHIPSGRTASLFSVVYRPNASYPARIQPRDYEIPDFFKKKYSTPAISELLLYKPGLLQKESLVVENPWVADTPSEFRNKLREAFNLGIVKSEVLCLATSCTVASESDHNQNESMKGE